MTSRTKLIIAILLSSLALNQRAATQTTDALTPKSLQAALAAKPSGGAAESLAESIRTAFGRDNLLKGAAPKVDELTVAWAIEAPNAIATPKVVSDDGMFGMPLLRVGNTDVYALAQTLTWGAAMKWHYEIGMQKLGGGNLEVYTTHPDSVVQPGVPRGEVTQQAKWESRIFPGTTRDWWVYVPAQYKPERPACVMVFQDGQNAVKYAPAVFDNLIAKGDIPVTVGIFLAPGTLADGKSNRSFEYDTLSDQYARFLLEEILPEVEKTIKLRHDAASRAIAGISSGGICAFTVAWQRPNEFSKVLSWVGSFTNIAHGATLREGGHNYPALVRKTKPPKPIRVFLQDGANDLDNANGNWPLANQEMAKALAFASYDYKFEWGHGFHSDRHGRAILPDSLRWLWRDYQP
ncbi:MAG TPA: alpha/beta hydrolase-fold protein [Blastocatellia bacterium]|nr:alpha/beta hydrolase-fold protein [Blastocatellia bacterium]